MVVIREEPPMTGTCLVVRAPAPTSRLLWRLYGYAETARKAAGAQEQGVRVDVKRRTEADLEAPTLS